MKGDNNISHTYPQCSTTINNNVFHSPKAHSASSLGIITNFASLRDDDNEMPEDQHRDTLLSVNNNSTNINPANHIKSIDSSSSSNSSHSDSSSIKQTFKNVFSIKSKLMTDYNNDTNNRNNLNFQNDINNGSRSNKILNIPAISINNNESLTLSALLPFKSRNVDIEEPRPTIPSPSASPKSSNNQNPNIFKRIISRKALIPKMKAFKRVADEIQVENYPLHDEMQHEMFITTAMKEEEEILSSKSSYSFLLTRNNSDNMLNYDNLKKFEIINKANASWNNKYRRKSSSSLTNSESFKSSSRRGSMTNLNLHLRRASVSSLTPTNTNNSNTPTIDGKLKNKKSKNSVNSFAPVRYNRKRKLSNDDESSDCEEFLSDDGIINNNNSNNTNPNSNNGYSTPTCNPKANPKRRIVSGSVTNSPKSPALDPFPFPSRRNSILMQASLQNASDDFELMSLK